MSNPKKRHKRYNKVRRLIKKTEVILGLVLLAFKVIKVIFEIFTV